MGRMSSKPENEFRVRLNKVSREREKPVLGQGLEASGRIPFHRPERFFLEPCGGAGERMEGSEGSRGPSAPRQAGTPWPPRPSPRVPQPQPKSPRGVRTAGWAGGKLWEGPQESK